MSEYAHTPYRPEVRVVEVDPEEEGALFAIEVVDSTALSHEIHDESVEVDIPSQPLERKMGGRAVETSVEPPVETERWPFRDVRSAAANDSLDD